MEYQTNSTKLALLTVVQLSRICGKHFIVDQEMFDQIANMIQTAMTIEQLEYNDALIQELIVYATTKNMSAADFKDKNLTEVSNDSIVNNASLNQIVIYLEEIMKGKFKKEVKGTNPIIKEP